MPPVAIDLPSLLRKNDVPSGFQAGEVRRLLEAEQSDLAQIKETIGMVSLILSELESQKSHRTQSVNALRGILSPIRRLPSELLAEIFLLCRNNSMRTTGYSIMNFREAPMVLSHISSRWRTVAIGTPMLWDTPRFRSSIVPPPIATCMRAVLDRSRRLPILLAFDTSGLKSRPSPTLSNGNTDCFQFFADLRDRLQHVSLDLCFQEGLERLEVAPINATLPFLISLDITTDDDGPAQLATIMASFRRAPSLRSLTLNAYFSPLVPPYDFPWAQLTSLTLSIPIDEVTTYRILIQCTQLETCILSEMNDIDGIPASQALCTLDVLRSFSFSPWEASSGDLLTVFSFPNLESLVLHGCDTMPAAVLHDLHARSKFTLLHVTLSGLQISFDELLEFLRPLSTLKSLVLDDSKSYIILDNSESPINDDLLRAFTYGSGSQVPSLSLPCLTTLEIRRSANSLTGSVVADMVASLACHSGDEGAPFPSIISVRLYLPGNKFSSDVESQLTGMHLNGFLTDTSRRE
ncbi:hypothetical protein B0H11DRAFT_1796641 [Mycena galericulata]|nr:hypothetical protein B0H11DRAFT_1796641 [Mycena galericulata]